MSQAIRLTPQQAGAQLEDVLDRLHTRYLADGVALMWREGVQAIKAGGAWIPQSSRPDYAGILPGGRFVAFDVKHCLEATYRHDVRTRAHQLIALWDAYEAGAVAGLLVCNLEAGRGFWVMPTGEWSVGQFVPRRLEFAREIPQHPAFEGVYCPDWIQVI